jgi:hypothetical protein
MSMKNLIESLIKKFGTPMATAKELGVAPQVITNWRNRGMSNKAIVKLLHQRPDLFPQPQDKGEVLMDKNHRHLFEANDASNGDQSPQSINEGAHE